MLGAGHSKGGCFWRRVPAVCAPGDLLLPRHCLQPTEPSAGLGASSGEPRLQGGQGDEDGFLEDRCGRGRGPRGLRTGSARRAYWAVPLLSQYPSPWAQSPQWAYWAVPLLRQHPSPWARPPRWAYWAVPCSVSTRAHRQGLRMQQVWVRPGGGAARAAGGRQLPMVPLPGSTGPQLCTPKLSLRQTCGAEWQPRAGGYRPPPRPPPASSLAGGGTRAGSPRCGWCGCPGQGRC